MKAQHLSWEGVKIEDVKIGDYIDMEAGAFLRRDENQWTQIDGGWGIEVPETDVIEWLKEANDAI